MKVSEALEQRKSVRAFVDTPVDNKLIRALLEKSARAASGGNLQPWRIFIINNEAMKAFLKHLSEWDKPETPAYDVYPEGSVEAKLLELDDPDSGNEDAAKAKYESCCVDE